MALNPFQQAISNLARSKGLRGQAEQQVYQLPEFQQLVNQFFGAIPLPAGINQSMVKSSSGGGLSYLDPEGYEHILERNLNALDPRLGQVAERSTNRPAVLPIPNQQQGQLSQLSTRLNDILMNPVALARIDPHTMELLATMKAAEDQALTNQFQRQAGTTTAQLVGNGIGASSIAGDIMAQLLKEQGLVKNQAQANQAQRELGVSEFLTGANQQQNQSLQQFITELLSQGTQRDISGAQVGVQREGLNLQNEQFFKNLQESIRQFDEQMRMQERQNLMNNIFKGVAAATGVASGVGGLFNKVGSAFGGNSLYLTPPISPYTPRNYGGNVNA